MRQGLNFVPVVIIIIIIFTIITFVTGVFIPVVAFVFVFHGDDDGEKQMTESVLSMKILGHDM